MMSKKEIYENARENLEFIQHQQATDLKELDRNASAELRKQVKETAKKIQWLTDELEKIQRGM